jgi:hypothetical protein
MHVSRNDLQPTVMGEYEGRTVDANGMRIAFVTMPSRFPQDEFPFRGLPDEIVSAGEAYHLRPGHFVQTLEPVELIELSPIEEHDRTMAAVIRNMGAVAS